MSTDNEDGITWLAESGVLNPIEAQSANPRAFNRRSRADGGAEGEE